MVGLRSIRYVLWSTFIVIVLASCTNLNSIGKQDATADEDSAAKVIPEQSSVKTVLDDRRYKLDLLKEMPLMGYVKFFRSGLEDYSPVYEIYQVHYGKMKLLGKITNDQALCIKIREGFTMFKVIADNGMVARETVKITTGKIKPLEVLVAWDKGFRFDHNNPYRWDIFTKHRYAAFDEKECRAVLVQ